MKIDINKKYRTVSAKWPVTIVSTDGPYPGFPVVGYADTTGTPLLCHWSAEGGYPANTHLDLVEVREPREFEICVAPDGQEVWHSDQGDTEKLRRDYDSGEIIRVREIID